MEKQKNRVGLPSVSRDRGPYPIRHSSNAQTLMLGILSLCAVVGLTNSSLIIPAIANSTPHRARHAHHPAGIVPSSLVNIKICYTQNQIGVRFAAVDNGTGASVWKNRKEFEGICSDNLC
jgi:hypothetical protein